MKKICKSIGLIALAFVVALGALLIPFKSKQSLNTASAVDTTETYYNFVSSDTYHIDCFYDSWTISTVKTILFSANVASSENGITISPHFNQVNISGVDVSYQMFHAVRVVNGSYVMSDTFTVDYGYIGTIMFSLQNNIGSVGEYYTVRLHVQENFNANVYKVTLGLSEESTDGDVSSDIYKYLNVTYYDKNDNFINFAFRVPNSLIYSTRTYYFINQFTDSEYYKQGVSDGYSTGLTEGELIGYNKGFQAGETQGFNNGYIDGVESANTYSFLGLIGAVVDAPVSVFSDLFNFELLGVNLLSFFTSLLTFCLCLWVLRLILGGK